MSDPQPTADDRECWKAATDVWRDRIGPVGKDEALTIIARHAADREAQVIAAVVARLRKLSGDEPLPKGCTTGEVWLLRAVADQFERGDHRTGGVT